MMKMKKTLAFALSAILSVSTFSAAITSTPVEAKAATASYSSIFKKDSVIDIKIDIPESDWQNMMDNATLEEYKSANVTVDGTKVENVGIRTKGNSSLSSVARSDSDRYSLRIKFNKYVKNQTLNGLDEIVLNNMFSDPSYMREYLSYEIMGQEGINATNTVFANIYVNGKLAGFYLCVQAIESAFLTEKFGDSSGNLYKAEQGSSLQYVEGGEYKSLELKNGKDTNKTGLKNFIKVLNEMPSGQKGNIESVLDVDSALKYIAGNAVLGNMDSYNGNFAQNYYLYELNGKFTVIPWDLNMSIGGFGGGDLTTLDVNNPISSMGVGNRGGNIAAGNAAAGTGNLPLITNLLKVPEYKTKYLQYIKDYMNILGNFQQRVTALSKIIRPYVEADPTKFYTLEKFDESVTYDPSASVSSSMGGGNRADGQTRLDINGQNNNQIPNGFDPSQRTGNFDPSQMPARTDMAQGPANFGSPQTSERSNMGQFPANLDLSQMPERPAGGDNMPGGGPGGDMVTSTNAPGIVNFIMARLANLKTQLS